MALSDPLGILASPLTIVTRRKDGADIREILEIIRVNDVRQIIAGLPISMNGTEGIQAKKTRDYAGELGQRTDIPIGYQDERLSTVEAKRMVREARKPGRTERYDAAAAALILQEYLNAENPAELPGAEPLST